MTTKEIAILLRTNQDKWPKIRISMFVKIKSFLGGYARGIPLRKVSCVREIKEITEVLQEPTPRVRFREVSIKTELTV